MPNVTFTNWNKTIRTGALASLRSIAAHAGITLHNGASKVMNCHGLGLCGTCRVKVDPNSALTPPNARERLHGCTGPMRLSCQAQVASDRADVTVTKMDGYLGKGDVPVGID